MSKEESTPYSFKGDNAKLVNSIKSLLALDSKGALVPNGVCGLARQLLESAAERLGVERQDDPVGWFTDDHVDDKSATTYTLAVAERWRSKGWPVTPLFTRSDAGEVDRLREELESTKVALREEMKDAFEFQQKNAALIELLRDIYNQNELSGFDDRRILAVIDPQPADSGASA
jgi:hypothetical protein